MNEELNFIEDKEPKKTLETENDKRLRPIEDVSEYSHLSEEKIELIEEAKRKYEKIYLCVNKTIDESFTEGNNGKILFWFNTEDKSTHMTVRG